MRVNKFPRKIKIIIDMRKANRLVFISLVPVILVYSLPYIGIYGFDNYIKGLEDTWNILLLVYLAAGILLHEGLHGLAMGLAAPGKFKSISFGFKWFAFYTHCSEPVKKIFFQIGVLLPWIVTGLAPFIYSLINGSAMILLLSIVFTWGAAGDFLVWWETLQLKGKGRILDHPTEIGFYYYPKS